jgi:hypothetical protein
MTKDATDMKGKGVIAMSQTRGEWLRDQRQARGWTITQMTRKLSEAAAESGDRLPGRNSLIQMIHRWEDNVNGMSERYRLHYCRAFQIPHDRFGEPAVLSVLRADGSARCDISREQPGVLLRLVPGSPSDDQSVFPVQIPLIGEELRTALKQLSGPKNHNELCFLLGYLSATMAARNERWIIKGG